MSQLSAGSLRHFAESGSDFQHREALVTGGGGDPLD
jgi:hypothetical protein